MVPEASFAAETTLEDFEHGGGSAAQQPPQGTPEMKKAQSFEQVDAGAKKWTVDVESEAVPGDETPNTPFFKHKEIIECPRDTAFFATGKAIK